MFKHSRLKCSNTLAWSEASAQVVERAESAHEATAEDGAQHQDNTKYNENPEPPYWAALAVEEGASVTNLFGKFLCNTFHTSIAIRDGLEALIAPTHAKSTVRSPKVIAVCGDEVHRGQHGQGGKEKEPDSHFEGLFQPKFSADFDCCRQRT